MYIFTVLAFLVVTPVILAFGFGIRYSPEQKGLVKTGGMYINAYPKTINLTIDGVTKQQKTPTRLRYLWPKTYSLQISKEGYKAVSTSVDIRQNDVLLFDPIELLPQNPSSKINFPGNTYFASPFTPQVLVFTLEKDGKISGTQYLNANQNSITGTLNEIPLRATWNAVTGDALIFTSEHKYIYIMKSNSLVLLPNNLSNPVLSEKESGIVYGNRDEQTVYFDGNSNLAHTSDVQGKFVYNHDGNFAVVKSIDGQEYLSVLSNHTQTQIQSLNDTQDIVTLNEEYALIKDAHEAYLFNIATRQLSYLDDTVTSYALSKKYLYYTNGFEVWQINLVSSEKKLINRFSDEINFIAVSPRESGLFITSEHKTVFWYLGFQKPSELDVSDMGLVQNIDQSSFQGVIFNDNSVTIKNFSI